MATATDMILHPSQLETKARALLESAARVPAELADDEMNGRAGDLIAFLTTAQRQWSAARVEEKAPHLEMCRQIDDRYRALNDELEVARAHVKRIQTAYLVAKEQRLLKEARDRAAKIEADRLAAAEAAEAAGLSDAANAALEAAVEAPQAPTAVGVVSRGDYGSTSSLRTVWDFVVEDFSALPDAYKLPNEVLLRGLAKAGRPQIPGVRWTENRVAVTRGGR